MRRIAKAALSWMVLTLGVIIGFLTAVLVGQAQMPGGSSSPDSLMQHFGFAGVCMLGPIFLVSSLVALHDRRRAGILFLAFAPIVAFCLAYSGSTFQLTGDDGNTYFYLPWFSRVVAFSFLFFLPFFALLTAIWNRKRAIVLFLISVAISSLAFGFSRWSWPLLQGLAASTVLFLVFGGFWLGTYKLRWAPVIAPKERSSVRRLIRIAAAFVLFVCLDITATFAFTVWRSTSNGFGCNKKPLFAEPLSPQHSVFTARLVRTGHSRRDSASWVGKWAFGRIEERYWGLPWSAPHYVLVTNNLFAEGEVYFIDGQRAQGLLTRFLPIVDAGFPGCNRTAPMSDAALELRVLREPVPVSGPRVVGYAHEPESTKGRPLSEPDPPVAGAKIIVSGSAGTTTIVTTDKDGIYEVDGLPPDDYTIKLALPDTQVTKDTKIEKAMMIQGGFLEKDFEVFWNGSIQGRVTDSKRGPAHAWVLLNHSDGRDLGPYVRSFLDTDSNGFFRIEKIPPGSYKLTVNAYGPSADSPFAPAYYPSAARSGDAGVLNIAGGQHIENIDFVLNPLSERKLRTLVAWPEGKPADEAWVYVAYENTLAYESLPDAPGFQKTDHGGAVDLQLFGDSRIRVFAECVITEGAISSRYSAPVELDTRKLPAELNLVVSTSRLSNSR
jgi:hypothetical protein